MSRPLPILVCCIMASATFAGQKFDFENFRDRLPWIWQTPRQVEPPKVKDSAWTTDAVDRFVLRKLEAEKLKPAGPANDRVWIRRVYFAITGLPPKPEDVQAFLNDTSRNRKRTLVRALLDSPHYGERWARHWMDLVRYAESRGHEGDSILPNAYRYRDYLIRAFNADLPYDALVTEHLAGDLLENPRLHPETGIDRYDKFHQGIGQTLHYSMVLKKPAVLALMLDKTKIDPAKTACIEKLCKHHKIRLVLLKAGEKEDK